MTKNNTGTGPDSPNWTRSCFFLVCDVPSMVWSQKLKRAITERKIIAVKGIGGFHLACDASNSEAVKKLRLRKGRVDKPFAVMVRDVDRIRAFAIVNEQECELLESKARPIVLLSTRKNAKGRTLKSSVAPGNDFIGVMLPYSPFHYLLMDESPLVMTSGNLTDEPIVRTNPKIKT